MVAVVAVVAGAVCEDVCHCEGGHEGEQRAHGVGGGWRRTELRAYSRHLYSRALYTVHAHKVTPCPESVAGENLDLHTAANIPT